MDTNRRDFIKFTAIAMSSLVLNRCIPFISKEDSDREDLRAAWLDLEHLAQITTADYEEGEDLRSKLLDEHRRALDNLIAAGDLSPAVAEQLQAAFTEATYHVWRSAAPFTCYLPAPGPNYTPISSDQLVKQAKLLTDVARGQEIEPSTVALAKAAIERDISFLNLSAQETSVIYEGLIQAYGETHSYPFFNEIDLRVSPDAAEAARYLVDLLLEGARSQ
jgi:hypothetical protein